MFNQMLTFDVCACIEKVWAGSDEGWVRQNDAKEGSGSKIEWKHDWELI